MGKRCSVVGCSSYKWCFKARERWLVSYPIAWKSHKTKTVCYKHFQPQDILGTETKFLHPSANPIFLKNHFSDKATEADKSKAEEKFQQEEEEEEEIDPLIEYENLEELQEVNFPENSPNQQEQPNSNQELDSSVSSNVECGQNMTSATQPTPKKVGEKSNKKDLPEISLEQVIKKPKSSDSRSSKGPAKTSKGSSKKAAVKVPVHVTLSNLSKSLSKVKEMSQRALKVSRLLTLSGEISPGDKEMKHFKTSLDSSIKCLEISIQALQTLSKHHSSPKQQVVASPELEHEDSEPKDNNQKDVDFCAVEEEQDECKEEVIEGEDVKEEPAKTDSDPEADIGLDMAVEEHIDLEDDNLLYSRPQESDEEERVETQEVNSNTKKRKQDSPAGVQEGAKFQKKANSNHGQTFMIFAPAPAAVTNSGQLADMNTPAFASVPAAASTRTNPMSSTPQIPSTIPTPTQTPSLSGRRFSPAPQRASFNTTRTDATNKSPIDDNVKTPVVRVLAKSGTTKTRIPFNPSPVIAKIPMNTSTGNPLISGQVTSPTDMTGQVATSSSIPNNHPPRMRIPMNSGQSSKASSNPNASSELVKIAPSQPTSNIKTLKKIPMISSSSSQSKPASQVPAKATRARIPMLFSDTKKQAQIKDQVVVNKSENKTPAKYQQTVSIAPTVSHEPHLVPSHGHAAFDSVDAFDTESAETGVDDDHAEFDASGEGIGLLSEEFEHDS